MSPITLEIESPRQADVERLLEALDAYQSALYPAESNHFLDVEALSAPDVRFFVARRNGVALGCAALRIDAAGYGELKRMFVRPEARGLKLGRLLLDRIEEEARQARLGYLRLETGIHQPEALGLYRTAGYAERDAFGEYEPDPLSVFMEKIL
ncbi:MAG: GNAT family N-acetyltransferase [Candidatus Rokuibacteriota bacterium]